MNENLKELADEVNRQDPKVVVDKYCKKPNGEYFCPKCGALANIAINPATQNSELFCSKNKLHHYHNVGLVLFCESLYPDVAAAVEMARSIYGLNSKEPDHAQKLENDAERKFYQPKIKFQKKFIPAEMIQLKHWILWKLQPKEDNPQKLEKIPYSAKKGKIFKADITDKKNWLSPIIAYGAYEDHEEFAGLGIVLSAEDDICCVDVDNCFNEDGTLNDVAQDVLKICGNSYAEKSQSGNGIHVFFADSEFEENRKGKIEIYGDKRFIAVTGNRISDTSEIVRVDGACKKLTEKYIGVKTKHTGEYAPMCFDYLDVLDSVERSAINYFQSEKCKRQDPSIFYLFGGNYEEYFKRRENLGYGFNDDSHSVADMDLMLKIFFYVGDSANDAKTMERVLKVFNKSALALREKWQNRDDYKARTLQQAFNFWASNGKKTAGSKASDDFDTVPDDVSLFDGLEKVKSTAGAILQVIPAEYRAPLNALLRDRNFSEFQALLPESEKYLTWLSDVLYQFFDNPTELKNFIADKLKKCNVPFQDFPVTSADEKKFDFTQHFKIQLEQFAKHSPNIKKSLLRLGYKDTKNFLYKSFTHLECAEILIDIQSEFLRYDVLQDDWYLWSKNKWSCVETQGNSRIFDLWTPIARKTRVLAEFEKFKRHSELDDFEIDNPDYNQKGTTHHEIWKSYALEADRADKKFKQTVSLENSQNINHILTQAAGLPEIKVETTDFNKNKFLFNCANGTIDFERREFYPARRDDLITQASPAIYDPSKQSKLWNDFITYALPDDETRKWLQKYLGYCLTGDTSQQIFLMVYGVGGCGKSLTFETVTKAMGDYAESFSPDLITDNNKPRDGNEPSPELAALKDKRLALSSETKRGKLFDEPKIKRWTGGNVLSCRKLHKPPFQFEPQFKIIIDGNYRLNISDVKDSGLQRRIRIIKFDNPPEVPDQTLAVKLSTPDNQSGILNWLIAGYRLFKEEGLPRPGDADFPAAMQEELNEFYSVNDTIKDFISDCGYTEIEPSPQNRIAVKIVWLDYVEWARDNRVPRLLRNDFVQSILQMFKGKVKITSYRNKEMFEGLTKISSNLDNLDE